MEALINVEGWYTRFNCILFFVSVVEVARIIIRVLFGYIAVVASQGVRVYLPSLGISTGIKLALGKPLNLGNQSAQVGGGIISKHPRIDQTIDRPGECTLSELV